MTRSIVSASVCWPLIRGHTDRSQAAISSASLSLTQDPLRFVPDRGLSTQASGGGHWSLPLPVLGFSWRP